MSTHRKYPSNWRQRERKRRWVSQSFMCFYCRRKVALKSGVLEHKTPISRGGSRQGKSNLAFACRSCDQDKGQMTAEEYQEYRRRGKMTTKWVKIRDSLSDVLKREMVGKILSQDDDILLGIFRGSETCADCVVNDLLNVIELDLDQTETPRKNLERDVEEDYEQMVKQRVRSGFDGNWLDVLDEISISATAYNALDQLISEMDPDDESPDSIVQKFNVVVEKLKILQEALTKIGVEYNDYRIWGSDFGGVIDQLRGIEKTLDEEDDLYKDVVQIYHVVVGEPPNSGLPVAKVVAELKSQIAAEVKF